MKLSLNWLKDYIDPKLSMDALIERLTMAGLEVETVESHGTDTVIEIEITPNRPDCLSMIGLAREISAIAQKNLKCPKITAYKQLKNKIALSIEDKKDCPRYIATILSNAQISPSDPWLTKRIEAFGIRPINNVVDITNFVLMETGQPLHAFDLDKIAGGKIVVRRARAEETLVTLDGVHRKLDPSILVIADAERPVAIAGIMGGMPTSITTTTKNILLESASFDMGLIRRTSRALALKSDSSYRFERSVDAQGVLTGANRATDLLKRWTKAIVAGRTDLNYMKMVKSAAINVSMEDIVGLLGTGLSNTQLKQGLTRLGMKVTESTKGKFKIMPPSFRQDLKQPVDVIEEVARMIGYDRLESSFPRIQIANIVPYSRPREIRQQAANALITQGYSETITYSLISRQDLEKTNLGWYPTVRLLNSLSQEHNELRPSLMPSLLKVALTNVNRGQKDLRLFELGKHYSSAGEEREVLGVLAMGRKDHDWRRNGKEPIEFYDLKGALQQAFTALDVPVTFAAGPYGGLNTATSAQIKLNGAMIGGIGKVDPQVLRNWDIKAGDIYIAEVQLEPVCSLAIPVLKHVPVVEFPGIARDISIAIPQTVAYAQIQDICRKFGGEHLKKVVLIEEYKGDKIPKDQRALVFSLTYQSSSRTLREEEVNTSHQHILKALSHELGAVLR